MKGGEGLSKRQFHIEITFMSSRELVVIVDQATVIRNGSHLKYVKFPAQTSVMKPPTEPPKQPAVILWCT